MHCGRAVARSPSSQDAVDQKWPFDRPGHDLHQPRWEYSWVQLRLSAMRVSVLRAQHLAVGETCDRVRGDSDKACSAKSSARANISRRGAPTESRTRAVSAIANQLRGATRVDRYRARNRPTGNHSCFPRPSRARAFLRKRQAHHKGKSIVSQSLPRLTRASLGAGTLLAAIGLINVCGHSQSKSRGGRLLNSAPGRLT
jgi:hypothetical protein